MWFPNLFNIKPFQQQIEEQADKRHKKSKKEEQEDPAGFNKIINRYYRY